MKWTHYCAANIVLFSYFFGWSDSKQFEVLLFVVTIAWMIHALTRGAQRVHISAKWIFLQLLYRVRNQTIWYASQYIWCLSQARINWKGNVRKGIQHKNGRMVDLLAPISLDGVAVHPEWWCICLCYLHIAPENTENDEMYLLPLAHLGCPGHSPESHKMVVIIIQGYEGKWCNV